MASTYLTRTISDGSNTKSTFSAWVKRSGLGATSSTQYLFHTSENSNNDFKIIFNSADNFRVIAVVSSSEVMNVSTNRKFRDTSAWYHFVVTIDTTESTAADRVKIYVNGVQETSFSASTYPAEDYSSLRLNNNGDRRTIGTIYDGGGSAGSGYFNGLMSHVHWVDGTAYQASTFGSVDSTTGEWKITTGPTLTMGTNGFTILKDGNTITDQSSNSNDFTLGGGTLTKTQDNPSNIFATVNPLWRNRYSNNGTFSNGNTTFSCNDTQNSDKDIGFASMGVTTGKWYWEVRVPAADRAQLGVGDAQQMSAFSSIFYDNNPSYGISLNPSNGNVNYNNTNTAYGSALSNDDIVMVALDMTNHRLWFGKNGSWFNSATTSEISAGTATNDVTTAISSQAILNTGEPMFPFFADTSESGRGKWNVNFGNGYFGTDAVTTNSGSGYQDADGNGIFNYALPTNYRALCTKGLNQ